MAMLVLILDRPILEKNHTLARDATKSSVAKTLQKWRVLRDMNENGRICGTEIT